MYYQLGLNNVKIFSIIMTISEEFLFFVNNRIAKFWNNKFINRRICFQLLNKTQINLKKST